MTEPTNGGGRFSRPRTASAPLFAVLLLLPAVLTAGSGCGRPAPDAGTPPATGTTAVPGAAAAPGGSAMRPAPPEAVAAAEVQSAAQRAAARQIEQSTAAAGNTAGNP